MNYKKHIIISLLTPCITLPFLIIFPEIWPLVLAVFLVGFACAGIIYLIEML